MPASTGIEAAINYGSQAVLRKWSSLQFIMTLISSGHASRQEPSVMC
jgi:hypothetical protein